MWVKICGVRTVEQALWAQSCGADAVGINLHAPSVRSISVDRAAEIAAAVAVETVLVVVDQTAEQLAELGLDEETANLANTMVMASRFMHFEGRPLLEMLPKAVNDIENYEWIEGEVFGGSIIGWNFGDGHLNGRRLLEAIQRQCAFEEGEVRLVSVESQPLFGRTMAWAIYDAATGLMDEGETEIGALREVPPWPTGAYAAAFDRGSVADGS